MEIGAKLGEGRDAHSRWRALGSRCCCSGWVVPVFGNGLCKTTGVKGRGLEEIAPIVLGIIVSLSAYGDSEATRQCMVFFLVELLGVEGRGLEELVSNTFGNIVGFLAHGFL